MIGLPLRRPLTRLAAALHRGRRSAAPSTRRGCRLVLESLEGRWVPSTVTNLNDAGAGSLRQAILDTPAGGTVDFQQGLNGTITLTSGELLINKNLTITGPGADVITVSGNQASRVFDLAALSTVNLSGLTIANGKVTTGNGGGIANSGTLTLTNATVSGCSLPFSGQSGAGIANTGTLTLISSTVSANTTSGRGGAGIYNTGTLTITGSTLSGNRTFATSNAVGGGIDNESGGTLTVTGSTLSGNSAISGGGGIYSSGGMLIVTSSVLSTNSASFSDGGGIYNGGTLTVTSSTFSGNTGGMGGGGIYNTVSGTLTVTSSTLSGNSLQAGPQANGGGIDNLGTLTVTNSTLSGNSATATAIRATGRGAGIANESSGRLTVTSCTLSGNSASGTLGGVGGGLDAESGGTVTSRNTIVAGNMASSSPDVAGLLTSQGHNLIGNGTGGSGFDPTDLVGTASNPIDPMLGPLQDNGGPTFTRALLPGSPAIDAGDNTDAPMWDQRGAPFRRIVNGTIDIGAFEVQARGHGGPTRQPLPNPVPVQLLGTPGGSVLGPSPDLPGDLSPLPGAGVPEGPAALPGSGPDLAVTADGQAVDAVLVAAADPGQAGASVGPWSASDLAPLAVNLLGGP